MTYSASGPSIDDGTFEMRVNALYLLKKLDHEKKKSYTLTVTATDNGTPKSKSTSVVVMVDVLGEISSFGLHSISFVISSARKIIFLSWC